MKTSIKKVALITTIFALTLIGFSSIIYARFTRQYNPEVSSFGVSISSQENMMISKTGTQGTFKDYLTLNELVSNTDVTLSPLTGKVTKTNDDTYQVLSLTDGLGNPASQNKYYAFDLYFIGSSDMNLYLVGNTTGSVAVFDDSSANPLFTPEQRNRLLKNLRVGFLTYSTTQPPPSYNIVYSDSPVLTNVYATEPTTGTEYTTFNRLGYTGTNNDTVLATTKKDVVTKMRIVIWLEKDGLEDIEAICKLTLSIRFEARLINN